MKIKRKGEKLYLDKYPIAAVYKLNMIDNTIEYRASVMEVFLGKFSNKIKAWNYVHKELIRIGILSKHFRMKKKGK